MRSLLRGTLPFVVLGAAACASHPTDPEFAAVRRIILEEIEHHPLMQPQDLYKLLHQAAMGSEHAMTDTAGVRAWMTAELASMGEGPVEPMVDTIAPGGAVVRVSLRPWVGAGRSTDSLTLAFIGTAQAVPPDTVRLLRYLLVADTLASQGALPFPADPWRAFVADRWREGWPAAHHSDAFVQAYRPAYRVVAGALVP